MDAEAGGMAAPEPRLAERLVGPLDAIGFHHGRHAKLSICCFCLHSHSSTRDAVNGISFCVVRS